MYAALAETSEERAARKLVEQIQAHGGRITSRELQRSNSRRYPTAEAAEAALNELVEGNLADLEAPPTPPRGGQPARHLRLRPTHDSTDSTEDGAEEHDAPLADSTGDSTPSANDFSNISAGTVGTVMRRPEVTEDLPPTSQESGAGGGTVGRNGVLSDDAQEC